MRLYHFFMIIFSAIFLASCGGGGGSSGTANSGTSASAPIISNVVLLTPSSATLNEGSGTTYIGGTFDFADADSDIIQGKLRLDSGEEISVNLDLNTSQGSVAIYFEVSTKVAGSYGYSLWMVDRGGNASNSYTNTFYVTEDLESNFANSGILIEDESNVYDEEALDVAVLSDGKIIVLGNRYNGLNKDIILQRYLADGTLDTSFGLSGTFTYDGGRNDIASGVLVKNDGKILIVGQIDQYQAGNENILLMRLNSDGTLDSTFGNNGIITTNISEYGETGHSLALQSDNKIVVAGEVTIGGNDIQAVVIRYDENGSLDNTFGASGLFMYDGVGEDKAYSIAIQADDKIVVTGSSSQAYPNVALTDVLLLRLDTSGSLDTAFGSSGVVRYDSIYESGNGVTIQSDGKIVVAATRWSYSSIESAVMILRYNADGSLDTNFGDSGVAIYQKAYGLPSMAVNDLAVAPSGDIFVAGYVNTDGLVLRLDNSGQYSTSFSYDGIGAVVSGGYAQLKAIWVANDGSAIVVGNSTFHDGYSDKGLFIAKMK